MKYVLLILVIFPIYTFAQKYDVDKPDEIVEPDPYKQVYFQDRNDYKRIRSVTTIIKNKHNNFRPDTQYIVYYNKEGLQTKNIRLNNNKESSTTLLHYDTNKNLLSWQLFEKHFSTLTLYSYNRNNQLEETRQLKLTQVNQNSDSAETSRMLYKYEHRNLIEILRSIQSNSTVEKYIYHNNRLKSKIGPYISKNLQFDKSGNILKVEEYMGNELVPQKLMGIKKYTFDSNNRLVNDSVLTASNFEKNKYQVTNYAYNENNLLQFMKVQYGPSYRNVEFIYSNSNIKEVNVTTNDGNPAYLRFWIDPKVADHYPFPIAYHEIFGYDENGNRTSKKVFLNKELYAEIEYKIDYKN